MTVAPCRDGDRSAARRDAAMIRAVALEMIGSAGFGFPGSCMSVADVLASLATAWDLPRPGLCRRDVVLLSKGHAAPALYALAHGPGWVTHGGYAEPGSPLQGHPRREMFPGTPSTTGSVGLAVGHAVGVWLARRAAGARPRLALVLGDGEMQAGATLEALAFTARSRATGVLVVVDANGRQSTGAVRSPEQTGRLLSALVDEMVEIDGHDVDALVSCFEAVDPHGPRRGVLAHTDRSAGVPELGLTDRPMSHLPPAEALCAARARLWREAGAGAVRTGEPA